MSECPKNIFPNDQKIILEQIEREVKKLLDDTTAALLRHDGKIAELCKYLKDNLSNSIRDLLDSMINSGEIDDIILTTITELNESFKTLNNTVGIRFVPLQGEENAECNTIVFNKFVNCLQTQLVDSGHSDHLVKWSIPSINIMIPEGEFYFKGFDIVQGLNLKGAGKNVTILHLTESAKIKYVYQQTLKNGVGNVNISDIFFYGNKEKSINCFEPEKYEGSGSFAHLIYSNVNNCTFYGFDHVFKVIGYNNVISHNNFNWCNRCVMIYGYDGKGNNGGDWSIHSNSANNIKEFITSTFSSLIHAFDNWLYQGLGSYINLLGWNRGAVIENNRLEYTTTNVVVHGGSLVRDYGKVYQKISNEAGYPDGDKWKLFEGLDPAFIAPYDETKNYNLLEAISIMIRNNNFHSPKSTTLKITGGQYITVQDNFSGGYTEQTAIIEGCQGLKYHNNMNINYEPNFYDDFKDWKEINSFNLNRTITFGTPEKFMNASYATSSPRGFNFRINDSINAFRVLENGGMYLMNNSKVVNLATASNSTKISMDCINAQSVVIFPRNAKSAAWYAQNMGSVYAECGNGNIAITHPKTDETISFNVIVI